MLRSSAGVAVLLGAMLLTSGSPAAAQGTPEQRAACQDDAMRLCGQFVPDVQQITACMHGKRRYLTARCRAVFDSGSKRRRAGI
ncbi:MAG: hypothetical protein IT537_00480 [Hyphomicrobiales bacterium]|nr:hypothetical protein [Hyphomicrobiales bacterium]